MSNEIFICKICNKEIKSNHHLQKHNITNKEYYDQFIKKENEGKCLCCGEETKFINCNKGYRIFCCRLCSLTYNEHGAKPGMLNVAKKKEVRLKISKTLKNRSDNEKEKSNLKRKKTNSKKSIIELNDIRTKQSKNISKTKTSKKYRKKFYKKLNLKYKSKNVEIICFDKQTNTKKCRCLKCNKLFDIKNNLFYVRIKNNESLCLHCNPIKKNFSRKESDVYNYIQSLTDKNIIRNDRTVLNGKELDIFIPELNLAFEFDGTYWHRDLRAFKKQLKNETFKNECYEIHKRDELKTKMCETLGIKLIRISEYDWDKNKDKVKQQIKDLL